MGRIVPKGLISTFAIKRLFKDDNSPAYWFKHKDEAKMLAYFGGSEKYKNISPDWKEFNLLVENKNDNGENIDYENLRKVENAKLINYYCDLDSDNFTLKDLQDYAKMHSGKLLSKDFNGDLYQKLDWETQDVEEFSASPFTVLKAGHWYNPIYYKNVWDFDRLSKKDKIYQEIWFDSHNEDENNLYYYDDAFKANVIKK